jgi:hypothetical protein
MLEIVSPKRKLSSTELVGVISNPVFVQGPNTVIVFDERVGIDGSVVVVVGRGRARVVVEVVDDVMTPLPELVVCVTPLAPVEDGD